MGYSEIHCKICGASFRMGRSRTADEPLDHAFRSWYGGGYDGWMKSNFVHKAYSERDNCTLADPNAGCINVRRKIYRLFEQSDLRRDEDQIDDDNEMDTTYIDSGVDDEDVALEYMETDDEETADSTDDALEGEAEGEQLEYEDNTLYAPIQRTRVELSQSIPIHSGEQTHIMLPILAGDEPDGPLRCDQVPEEDVMYEYKEEADLGNGKSKMTVYEKEHLAGPGCINHDGYAGSRISYKEMEGCTTVQCLMRKDANWTPDDDDMEWERKGQYYLSGLSGHLHGRWEGGAKPSPPRHGVDNPEPDDVMWELGRGQTIEDLEREVPMPFHPHCLEIFNRVSKLRMSRVDMNGLAGWRRIDSHYDKNYRFPRSEDLRKGQEQDWHHEPGHEYLAANPIMMPQLKEVLEAAIIPEEAGTVIDPNSSPFGGNMCQEEMPDYPPELDDWFLALPRELIMIIIEHLDSKDIANLRLASRAFRHLPMSLWRRLMREEFPSLWEAFDPAEPYPWALTTAKRMEDERARRQEAYDELLAVRALHAHVFREECPEIWDAYRADHEWLSQPIEDLVSMNAPYLTEATLDRTLLAPYLPPDRTNWYALYCGITRAMKTGALKGLRNRERIWTDCEEIVRRIKAYRKAGEIMDWAE